MLRITLEYDVKEEKMIVKEDYQDLGVFSRCDIEFGKLKHFLISIIDAEHKCEDIRSSARDISHTSDDC